MHTYKEQRLEGEHAAIEGTWFKGRLHGMKIQKIERLVHDGNGYRYVQGMLLTGDAVKEILELIEKSGWLLDNESEDNESLRD